jgi:hypothetical protein
MMSVILEFRRPEGEFRSKRLSRDDAKPAGALGEIVIFPGIRVDYGPVEAALAGPDKPCSASKPGGKRRKA